MSGTFDRERVLGAYRARHDYEPSRAAATWRGLEERLEAGDGPRFDDAPAPVATTAPRRVWGPAVALAAVAAALVLVWIRSSTPQGVAADKHGPASQANFEAQAPVSVGEVREDVPSPVASRPDVEQQSQAVEPEVEPLPAEPEPKKAAVTKRRGPQPDAGEPSAMRRELQLMQRAQLALSRSAPKQALRHLDTHAREFPRGSLAPERNGLRAVALCRLGRTEGPAAAKAFLRAHPRSSLRSRIASACMGENAKTSRSTTQIGPAGDN